MSSTTCPTPHPQQLSPSKLKTKQQYLQILLNSSVAAAAVGVVISIIIIIIVIREARATGTCDPRHISLVGKTGVSQLASILLKVSKENDDN